MEFAVETFSLTNYYREFANFDQFIEAHNEYFTTLDSIEKVENFVLEVFTQKFGTSDLVFDLCDNLISVIKTKIKLKAS